MIRERSERDELFLRYSYLCKRGSRKFFRGTVERSDLEQTAAIGLLKACERFEDSAGTPFEAYAWLMVVGELMHFVRDFERPVRVPRGLRRLDAEYAAVRTDLTERFHREPNVAEIARAMGVAVPIVDELRMLNGGPLVVPLDATAAGIDARVKRGFVRSQAGYDDGLLLRDATAVLTDVERLVVNATYVDELTQREIGERIGMRQRQVSRVLERAREKLVAALG
jgi:RNA polymerase sigma-B factor